MIVSPEQDVDRFHILAHGKVDRLGAGKYGHPVSLGVLSDGAYFGEQALIDEHGVWEFGFRAVTPASCCPSRRTRSPRWPTARRACRSHLDARLHTEQPHTDADGEAAIELSSGHQGEPTLPHTYVAYETHPREYELSVAQTVLRVHSRVADLYNEPMNQVEQQLRLTVEALRERQEHEIVNNRDFGLLHNADHGHRISTPSGPPHPGRPRRPARRRLEGTRRSSWPTRTPSPRSAASAPAGLYPSTVDILGREVPAWRGVPILVQQAADQRHRGVVHDPHADRRGQPGRRRPPAADRGCRTSTSPASTCGSGASTSRRSSPTSSAPTTAPPCWCPTRSVCWRTVELRAPGLKVRPFDLPDFYRPWPPRLNPHVEAARAHNRA